MILYFVCPVFVLLKILAKGREEASAISNHVKSFVSTLLDFVIQPVIRSAEKYDPSVISKHPITSEQRFPVSVPIVTKQPSECSRNPSV